MDEAYNQHASQARRKNRSSTNLNHLSLAPLTSKLPLTDPDAVPDALTWPQEHNISYLQGKSAPTTPALISRAPATPTRSRSRGVGSRPASASGSALASGTGGGLLKSKSASHLATPSGGRRRGRKAVSGTVSPTSSRHRRRPDDLLSRDDRSDSDWLLRAGALISSETRESKGQAWLVSRASSTSLAGLPTDPEEEAFERELARERGELVTSRQASRHASRRGSTVGFALEGEFSPTDSGIPSRSHSRVGSRSRLALAALDRHGVGAVGIGAEPGYFDGHDVEGNEHIPGPDFVNLDEKLEAIEQQQDTSQEDEAAIRRLVKTGHGGVAGSWMGTLLGWSLFSVDENDEEDGSLSSRGGGRHDGDDMDGSHPDGDDDDDEAGEEDHDDVDDDKKKYTGGQHKGRRRRRRSPSRRGFPDDHDVPDNEETIPPPTTDEGGWKDAAWLLSVATKVLL